MKEKKYYLVAHWCQARGSTRENPAYYFGPYSSYFPTKLENIKPDRCYRSEKMALKMVEKSCNNYWWAAVVEVPVSALAQ